MALFLRAKNDQWNADGPGHTTRTRKIPNVVVLLRVPGLVGHPSPQPDPARPRAAFGTYGPTIVIFQTLVVICGLSPLCDESFEALQGTPHLTLPSSLYQGGPQDNNENVQ